MLITRRNIVLTLVAIFALGNSTYSQRASHFTTNDYWKEHKKEILFGVGISNFLSDLGGLNGLGKDYSPLDLEFPMTIVSGHLGYRYRFANLWQTKTQLQYGQLKGSDALTAQFDRNYRNIHVRTHLIELSQTLEFIILKREQYGKRYSVTGLNGHRNVNDMVYISVGVTAFMYMPQAMGGPFLRPLNTEGQGIGGPKPYGLIGPGAPMGFSSGIPMGIGAKYGLTSKIRLQLEFTFTKTFTDYLDDTSGEYFDNVAIYNAYGATAAYYADPSSKEFPGKTEAGEIRGHHITKDSYMFLNLSMVINLSKNSKPIRHMKVGRGFKSPKGKW